MPTKTKIQWADYVSNPIFALNGTKRGWACVKISPGCEHCWASKFNVRLGTGFGMQYTAANMKNVQMNLDERKLTRMAKFNPRGSFKWGRSRALVFPFDMTDLFGEWVSDEWLDRLFQAMWMNQNVDWLILTKRAGRMAQYCVRDSKKPLNNIYLGCTVEDQKRADLRVHPMRALHAEGWKTVVSYEPALSDVDWNDWHFLDWLICGGESGSEARPMHLDWARHARDFCARSSIPYFFKQWGEFIPFDGIPFATDMTTFKHKPIMFNKTILCRVGKGMAGRVLDGREHNEVLK